MIEQQSISDHLLLGIPQLATKDQSSYNLGVVTFQLSAVLKTEVK